MTISYTKLLICTLFFIASCTERKYILERELADNSRIYIYQYDGMSTSENPFWVLRKINGQCYLTGEIQASSRYEKIEITNESDSGFRISINYRITNQDTAWVHHQINFRDTFCLNGDCKKYPINCEDFQ